jgi:RimJ/RimL family protein N-acetyltransferase
MITDADVLRFTRVPDPIPDGWAETWLASYERGRSEGTREGFAIVGEDGEFLGIAVAPDVDRPARTAELGYVLAPSARGRGVATEALELLTRWAFEEVGIERAQLYISTDNVASKRVAEKAGYVFEGVLRSMHFKGDLREDTEVWSRLPSDPSPTGPTRSP